MKLRVLLLSIIATFAFIQSLNAATRLSILRQSGSVTHQWQYMPSGILVTQQGIKSKQYPITLLPTATYIESEFINIEGCDLEMTISYNVATDDTHSAKVELIDENGNTIYSFVNEEFQASSQLTGGEIITIGVLNGATRAKIRVSLSEAYNSNEAINITALELYSKNGAGINSISTDDFNISCQQQSLIVSSDKNTSLEVISTGGSHVKKCALHPGENRLFLAPGLYIIKIGSHSRKVIISR